MAGKVHTMDFVLNAALNGNFKGTFSRAQQEFVRLGKEIQGLNRLQSDISSYQKQQKAVQNTEAKLRNLEKQYDLIQQEIRETNGPTASLEREQAKLEQRIRETTAAFERQNQKLSATEQRLKDAKVDTGNLSGESQRLAAQMQELARRQEETARAAQSFGGSVQDAFSAAQQALASAGIATGLHEIYEAYAECVTIAADFESSMSNVEALSGSTAQEMAELTAAAKELGANTKYTAQQAADAMGFMGMAGWKAQEMLDGMDGVINLAAAAGEDLAQVSDIVTNNLTAFGLTAADTAHFSDVLAAAATNSNTSVSIMGKTFKQSASIAGALGYSIEDVAVGVGLMANAGVKGSIAGTALKNTFNGLLEGVTLTGAAFGEYEFSAIKANGTMKEFSDTVDELRVCFDQMTEDVSSSALAAANVADTYINKLEAMGDSAKLSADGQQQYQNTLALLLQTVPSLSDCISQTTDEYGRTTYALETNTTALRDNVEAWKQNAMAQAYQERLTAMYAAQADVLIEAEKNSVELTRAQTSLEQAEEKRSETLGRMNDLYRQIRNADGNPEKVRELQYEYNQLSSSLGDVDVEIQRSRDVMSVYTQALEDGQEAVNKAQEEISLLEEAFRRSTGAVEEQTHALPELDAALAPVEATLSNLAAAYSDTYNEAYNSISGQFGLFDEMAVKVDTSVSDMISSLESQASYMATYSENLRKAADMGLSEGLLSRLSDGSTQSAAYLQAIVNSGETKIEELNAAFAQVEEGKETFSGAVAEIQIGLDEAMTEMERIVQEGVEGMDLPDEAQESARSTIQAFIDQAETMQPWVRNAYAQLGQLAANALGVNLNAVPYGDSAWAANRAVPAFADGTSNAPPGWAWVGEEGPELIHMRGGETVLPAEISRQFTFLTAYQDKMYAYAGGTGNAAAEAARLVNASSAAYAGYSEAIYNNGAYEAVNRADYTTCASPPEAAVSTANITDAAPAAGSGSSAPINVEIHIHIEGSATPETVQVLENYVSRGELQTAVLEVMESVQADARRRDWF